MTSPNPAEWVPPQFIEGPPEPRRRPGRPRRVPEVARLPARRITEGEVRAGIASIINAAQAMVFAFVPEDSEAQADRLTGDEVKLLADALAAEAQGSTTAMRWLEKARGGGRHAKLLIVVAVIAAPRLARRGIIPGDFEVVQQNIAGLADVMGGGGAPGPDRPDGVGQDHPGAPPPAGATVVRGGQDQARRPGPGDPGAGDLHFMDDPAGAPV